MTLYFLLHFRQKCGVNIKDELSAAANLMENIFEQLESTNPKVAVEERTKIAQYLSKFIKGGDVASKQITTKMSLWGKELVDESGEKKHIGVQVINYDFKACINLRTESCRKIISLWLRTCTIFSHHSFPALKNWENK